MSKYHHVWHKLSSEALLSPNTIKTSVPLSASAEQAIMQARQQVLQIMTGEDNRLLVILGPCSVHDINATLEYAKRLEEIRKKYAKQLHLVMRVYFEKPRTTTGWKGLINDPHLDGSHAINDGLLLARRLLSDITELGVPAATEFIDTLSPTYISDFISWGAIGARSSEARLYRELASGLPMVVGFKNNTDGNIQIAVDAVETSRYPHRFFSIDDAGRAAIIGTQGNPHTHLILRGANHRTNYSSEHIEDATNLLKTKKLPPYIMVDCSHGNSRKTHLKQRDVAENLAQQIGMGNCFIAGIMLESFLAEGRQELAGKKALNYGQSITDACLSWEQTLPILDALAESVEKRRIIY